VALRVAVAVPLTEGVADRVGVAVGVAEPVEVLVAVGVPVDVDVPVPVGVAVADAVPVKDCVGVTDGEVVTLGDGVRDRDGDADGDADAEVLGEDVVEGDRDREADGDDDRDGVTERLPLGERVVEAVMLLGKRTGSSTQWERVEAHSVSPVGAAAHTAGRGCAASATARQHTRWRGVPPGVQPAQRHASTPGGVGCRRQPRALRAGGRAGARTSTTPHQPPRNDALPHGPGRVRRRR
jgi:hypothetical protein